MRHQIICWAEGKGATLTTMSELHPVVFVPCMEVLFSGLDRFMGARYSWEAEFSSDPFGLPGQGQDMEGETIHIFIYAGLRAETQRGLGCQCVSSQSSQIISSCYLKDKIRFMSHLHLKYLLRTRETYIIIITIFSSNLFQQRSFQTTVNICPLSSRPVF